MSSQVKIGKGRNLEGNKTKTEDWSRNVILDEMAGEMWGHLKNEPMNWRTSVHATLAIANKMNPKTLDEAKGFLAAIVAQFMVEHPELAPHTLTDEEILARGALVDPRGDTLQ